MSTQLRGLLGHPSFEPVMAYIAEQTGVSKRHTPLDAQERIDPLELAGQKALRDFGLRFFEDAGWNLALVPPQVNATPRQQQAEGEGADRA